MALFTLDNPAKFASVLELLGPGDLLLLLGEALICVSDMAERLDVQSIYALSEDAAALGVEIPDGIHRADYETWVALAAAHEQHVHWR